MFIPDPDLFPYRISDPKTATKERGEKNLLSYLFCSLESEPKLRIAAPTPAPSSIYQKLEGIF
jgi:hypothetical protein